MSTTLYDLTVASYLQVLQGTAGVLAAARKFCEENGQDVEDLVSSCFADDMWPLNHQIFSVMHHSGGAIAGLKAGEFGPPSIVENDYAGLEKMIADTIASLQAESADEINALAGGQVIFKIGGNEIPFTTENFVMSFSLPNFYFHATTAYDLLRQKGVPIGKMNFLGPMRMG